MLIKKGNIPAPETLKIGRIIGSRNLPRNLTKPKEINRLEIKIKGNSEGSKRFNQIFSPSLALFILSSGLDMITNIIIKSSKTIKKFLILIDLVIKSNPLSIYNIIWEKIGFYFIYGEIK